MLTIVNKKIWRTCDFPGNFQGQEGVRIMHQCTLYNPKYSRLHVYDKNSESDYFFFPPPKSEYFFQQHWESEYFFRKNHNPPLQVKWLFP
jgi:hypothetical protein